MSRTSEENAIHLLRQMRILLTLVLLILLSSIFIDPPFSVLGMSLNWLIVLMLAFLLFRIQKFISATNSTTAKP